MCTAFKVIRLKVHITIYETFDTVSAICSCTAYLKNIHSNYFKTDDKHQNIYLSKIYTYEIITAMSSKRIVQKISQRQIVDPITDIYTNCN